MLCELLNALMGEEEKLPYALFDSFCLLNHSSWDFRQITCKFCNSSRRLTWIWRNSLNLMTKLMSFRQKKIPYKTPKHKSILGVHCTAFKFSKTLVLYLWPFLPCDRLTDHESDKLQKKEQKLQRFYQRSQRKSPEFEWGGQEIKKV